MTYFTNCRTLEEVKKEYKRLCMKLHPDVSGADTTTEFQDMSNQYEEAFNRLKNVHVNVDGKFYEKETTETPQEFADLIAKLLNLDGVIVEVIGCFLWLSGNTKAHKEEIKQLGFRWHPNKKTWYKAPLGYKKRSKKNYDMDAIRDMFGSTVYEAKQDTQLTF